MRCNTERILYFIALYNVIDQTVACELPIDSHAENLDQEGHQRNAYCTRKGAFLGSPMPEFLPVEILVSLPWRIYDRGHVFVAVCHNTVSDDLADETRKIAIIVIQEFEDDVAYLIFDSNVWE